MIIDIVNRKDGEGILRYHSDIAPKFGETITLIPDTYDVVNVDHLLKIKAGTNPDGNQYTEQLITVQVVKKGSPS